MNLNSQVFDNVLAIDERLRQLEEEVSSMDAYYAHRGAPEIPNHFSPKIMTEAMMPMPMTTASISATVNIFSLIYFLEHVEKKRDFYLHRRCQP